MPRERCLLERLRDPSADQRRSSKEDTGSLVKSIISHLANMFNTKQGHSLTQPKYGIPDFNDIVFLFPEAKDVMEREIREAIEKFEPRLSGVNVRYFQSEEDGHSLRFEVTARLATSEEHGAVRFVTKFKNTREVDVES
ncbi:type VI secretion system baseplate subunit TssE [Thermodesulfobacteriota bacterium]